MAATYSPAYAVPSALMGLTSLFGMGRGGAPSLLPPKRFQLLLHNRKFYDLTGKR